MAKNDPPINTVRQIPLLMTKRQAREALGGISEDHLDLLREQRLVETIRVGLGKRTPAVRITAASIANYIEKRRVK